MINFAFAFTAVCAYAAVHTGQMLWFLAPLALHLAIGARLWREGRNG